MTARLVSDKLGGVERILPSPSAPRGNYPIGLGRSDMPYFVNLHNMIYVLRREKQISTRSRNSR